MVVVTMMSANPADRAPSAVANVVGPDDHRRIAASHLQSDMNAYDAMADVVRPVPGIERESRDGPPLTAADAILENHNGVMMLDDARFTDRGGARAQAEYPRSYHEHRRESLRLHGAEADHLHKVILPARMPNAPLAGVLIR